MIGTSHRVAVFLTCLLATACYDRSSQPTSDSSAWSQAYESWRAERLETLHQPDGWLTVTGLYWLADGAQTFGFAAPSDIVLTPTPSLTDPPALLGTLVVDGTTARLEATAGTALTIDGASAEIADLLSDAATDGEPTVLAIGSVTMYLIERGGQLGLRVKDSQSPKLASVTAIPAYPLDEAWRIEARWQPFAEVRELPIPNVTGREYGQRSAGQVVFEHQGAEYALDVIGADATEPLLLVVGDETNGKTTYGGGRYVYVEVDGDHVELDFNRLYNPPCVFTEFATCPLPSRHNRLPFPIEAGEQMIAAH